MVAMADSHVVNYLHDQHDLLRQLMHDVRTAEPSQRAALFMDFKRFLAIHEALEGEVIHPAAERLSHSEFDEVSHSLTEEHAASESIARLESLDPNSVDFLLEFAELDRMISDHAHHEERDEFPGLSRLDDAADSARIAAALGRSLEMALHADHGEPRGRPLTFSKLLGAARREFQSMGRTDHLSIDA